MSNDIEELMNRLKECLIDLDKECVLDAVKKLLERNVGATEIVFGPMSKAMEKIGRLYEEGEYFIAELMEAAEIFKEAMKILEPLIKDESAKMRGRKRLKIIIGTVKGDIHDIGKTLVAVMLQAAGHEVIDLGVDVDSKKFIEAIMKYNPDIVAMSALLTTTARYMREVIKEIEKAGLRDKVKIIIGGAATTKEFAEEIGADGWSANAIEAVKLVNRLSAEKDGADE
ncbi:MAG: corrinoid protein [Staphylothermus sp.]|nr:corrinoid protein [Staphylothermus sp.]